MPNVDAGIEHQPGAGGIAPLPDLDEARCRQCRHSMPAGATICATCKSYQDWRSIIPFSNTALALLTALVSTTALAFPVIQKAIHTPTSQATLTMPSLDGTTLRIIALNRGDAPAAITHVWVDSDYLAAATKVRFRDDAEAILKPGSQLLTFDILPLLDEDDSYRSSMEMLSHVVQHERAPRTEIRFDVQQSDGRFAIQAVKLDAGDLFSLLRANADRCSAMSELNFENGCIGRGTPPDERFPKKGKNIPKGLVDSIEARIDLEREQGASSEMIDQ